MLFKFVSITGIFEIKVTTFSLGVSVWFNFKLLFLLVVRPFKMFKTVTEQTVKIMSHEFFN